MAQENDVKPSTQTNPYPELYTLLHNERVSLATEVRSLETTVATAIAVLYAWLATAHIRGPVWYIGPTLVVLAAFRAGVLGGRILFIKDYLKSIEGNRFAPDVGFESYFQTHATPSKWYLHLRFTAAAIWLALFVASAGALYYLDR
jgi:hypothetical protein